MNVFRRVAILLLWTASSAFAQDPEGPLFSFGVIADVQYADKPDAGARHYRSSLKSLETAVARLNEESLRFTVHLGDFIDEGEASLDRALPVFERLEHDRVHVLGNHDYYASRAEVVRRFGMLSAYHSFVVEGWRFVVLDGLAVSLLGLTEGDDHARDHAQSVLDALARDGSPNAQPWNGGLGERQLGWLRTTLSHARDDGQPVVLFCHLPALEASTEATYLLWDHVKLVQLLGEFPGVVAYFNGHDHGGGYAQSGAIHYVTIPGMVEAPMQSAFAVVDVYADHLAVRGFGKVPSRTLRFGR
jgi:predicted phosphodiesterase